MLQVIFILTRLPGSHVRHEVAPLQLKVDESAAAAVAAAPAHAAIVLGRGAILGASVHGAVVILLLGLPQLHLPSDSAHRHARHPPLRPVLASFDGENLGDVPAVLLVHAIDKLRQLGPNSIEKHLSCGWIFTHNNKVETNK